MCIHVSVSFTPLLPNPNPNRYSAFYDNTQTYETDLVKTMTDAGNPKPEP